MRRTTRWLCIMLCLASLTAGCSATSGGADPDIVPECGAYEAALDRCMSAAGTDIGAQRRTTVRQAFTLASKDPAEREKLAAQCRAAERQLARACR